MTSVIACTVLLCMVWLVPVEFTACEKGNIWCSIAYCLTESAGKIGTAIIVFVVSYFYTIRFEKKREKIKVYFKSLLALSIFLGVFAYANEHLTKKAWKVLRPSQMYVIEQSGFEKGTDSLILMEKEDRRIFIQQLITTHSHNFALIDTKILDHWIEESGYSFPSGHSFNAFLLASIMSFSLYHSHNKTARKIYILPLIWAVLVAISRVAVGAHSPLDVSFGAFAGMLIANMFLYFDNTRKLITHRTHTI